MSLWSAQPNAHLKRQAILIMLRRSRGRSSMITDRFSATCRCGPRSSRPATRLPWVLRADCCPDEQPQKGARARPNHVAERILRVVAVRREGHHDHPDRRADPSPNQRTVRSAGRSRALRAELRRVRHGPGHACWDGPRDPCRGSVLRACRPPTEEEEGGPYDSRGAPEVHSKGHHRSTWIGKA